MARWWTVVAAVAALACVGASTQQAPPRAFVDGTEPGWVALGEADFVNVNTRPETWTWQDGTARCTGQPVGVIRSVKTYTNFELILQWRHLRSGGNSGVFLWTQPASLQNLQPGQLPHGIEVQVLDHGFRDQYERQSGRRATWFTTHGDVFPVGSSSMTPFPPVSPDGSRSFPRKQLTRGVGQWNHYYIRAVNGEVRLWVNGQEVSGGTACRPATGYLCLQSEGSPIEFRGLRIRELP
ncbi:MAG TPA: DUF1080 domain-containing protein [Chthonomonadales bacterium]|nr:DUF1080 domain-containing protein [Chthonomonadales bacterium]